MKTIQSIQEYIKFIIEQQRDEVLIYRGHSSIDYELKPSIGRTKYSEELERFVFSQFKQKYHLFFKERLSSDLEVLFLAQHYGLPTRLLDWSYNPMVALYFACKSNPGVDGTVYCLSIENVYLFDCNNNFGTSCSFDEIVATEKNIYIVPNYMDIRYNNQKSLFLLCSQPHRKFTFAKPIFRIDKDFKRQILKELAILGYDELLLFPQLDSLCNDIKMRSGLIYK